MIMLEPYKKCPFGSFCEFSRDGKDVCPGLDEKRSVIFICELWAENYETHVLKELEELERLELEQ